MKMRPKLLKMVFRKGELAMGVSLGIMATRLVVDIVAKKYEKSARREQEQAGELSPATNRKVRIVRAARGILHIL